MISITELNKRTHDMWCKALEIDKYEIDTMAQIIRDPDKIIYDSRTVLGRVSYKEKHFSCPVIHWWIGDKKYSAAIPIHTKTTEYNEFLSSGDETYYDWDKMQKEAFKLIQESKNA